MPEIAEEDILTVTYYDNYELIPQGYEFVSNSTINQEHLPDNLSQYTKGQITATKTKVLSNQEDIWLWSVIYYDKYLRVIQTITDNHLEGYDRISNNYNFVGDLLETKQGLCLIMNKKLLFMRNLRMIV